MQPDVISIISTLAVGLALIVLALNYVISGD